jgi:undecaprenyl-diphosphatase
MPIPYAILLGAVQGLTEFVPISSTAHLFLAQVLLGIDNNAVTLAFDIVLHLGTVLALVLATWRDLASIVSELFRWVTGRPVRDPAGRALILPILVGTVPGVLAGLFLLRLFESMRTVGLIGISMVVACLYFLLAEGLAARRVGRSERGLASLGLADAVWVGIAQAAAGLMAGFSRSGFTISTGRLRGMRREEAARFSFVLALPIILGAGAKALLDLRGEAGRAIGFDAMAGGFLASTVVGYLAVRFLLRYLRTHTLRPFAVYMGLVGLALVIWSVAEGRPILGG